MGFLLTTALGVAGAFAATFVGQTVGWYRVDQGAGILAATRGAFAVLFVWNRLVVNRTSAIREILAFSPALAR